MNLTLRQLRAFVLTANHRSFSRAAEQLFITQSGISVMMREMEIQLGFRLFDRTTRKVTLTPFGKELLPVAQSSLQALQSSVSEIARNASAQVQRFTIGVTPLMAAHLLPPVVAAYARSRPGTQIRIYDADRPRVIAMVEAGELDIGLGVFMKPTPNIRATPLFRFSLMAIGARRAQLPRRPGWKDLRDLPLVALPPDSHIQQLVARHFLRVRRKRPPELVVNSLEAQIAMTEAGAGFAVVPTFAIPACRRRRVRIYPLRDPVVDLDLYQILNRGRSLPPEVESFISFLKDSMAGWATSAC
jgi:DNA-binding transcriptional LysR family regulator